MQRIHVFFGLPSPDPLVKSMDPDSALENNLNLPSKNDKAKKIVLKN